MNGDDHKDDYFPSPENEEPWRDDARSLLEQLRKSRVCVFPGLPTRRGGRVKSFLDCLARADAYDTLICFEPRSGKAAIRAKFARLEEHVLHNLGYSVGDVTITEAVQEPDDLYRDVVQQPIFFPDTQIAWHTGEPEPKRKEKKWLHIDYHHQKRHQLRPRQTRAPGLRPHPPAGAFSCISSQIVIGY